MPAAWRERGRVPLWLKIVTGWWAVLGLGSLVVALVLLWQGEFATGLVSTALAVFFAHIVWLAVRTWWPRRRSPAVGVVVGGEGLTFPYSGWAYYTTMVVVLPTALLVLLVVAGLAASATVVGIATAVVIGAAVLVTGWLLVTMLRLAPGRVVLSPAGVYQRGLTSTHFIPWLAIRAVSARWLGTPVVVVEAAASPDTLVRRYMGRLGSGETQFLPFMVIRPGWLAADAATVYHALAFYQANPALRVELGSPAALDRIRTGRAVAYESTR